MLQVSGAVTEMEDGFMTAGPRIKSLFCDVCKRNLIERWKLRLMTNNEMESHGVESALTFLK
jgi:hypothetical protein